MINEENGRAWGMFAREDEKTLMRPLHSFYRFLCIFWWLRLIMITCEPTWLVGAVDALLVGAGWPRSGSPFMGAKGTHKDDVLVWPSISRPWMGCLSAANRLLRSSILVGNEGYYTLKSWWQSIT